MDRVRSVNVSLPGPSPLDSPELLSPASPYICIDFTWCASVNKSDPV